MENCLINMSKSCLLSIIHIILFRSSHLRDIQSIIYSISTRLQRQANKIKRCTIALAGAYSQGGTRDFPTTV